MRKGSEGLIYWILKDLINECKKHKNKQIPNR
jgi:hypothetical protein